MISSRSAVRASFEVESVPSPSIAIVMLATVFAALMSTSIGSFMTPLSIARHLSSPIASCTAGASTFGALTTTIEAISVPGNASLSRLYVPRNFCGIRVDARLCRLELDGRHRKSDEQAAGQHHRHDRDAAARDR